MRTEIKKLHQRLNATIVYVTHDQVEAMTLASRIAVMKGGVLQQLGTPHEVYNRPANTFVAGFMGSPRMNLLKARVQAGDGGLALDIAAGKVAGARFVLPAEVVPAALAGRSEADVIAGIRAEAIALARDGAAAAPLQRAFDARAEVIEPTGADTLVVLEVGDQEITARLGPDAALKPGQNARFCVDLSKLVFFDAQSEALLA
jgi:multiple sugar transport system ATP-binding protein